MQQEMHQQDNRAVMDRIAKAFLEFGDHRRALDILADLGSVETAIEIAEAHQIIIDEAGIPLST